MTSPLFDPPDPHPAIALYRTWDMILKAAPGGDRTPFGHFAWALERIDDKTIGYGQQWGQRGFVTCHWMIDADGRFRWNAQWGDTRRSRITEVVPFLAYGWAYSRYQWLVNHEDRKWYGWQGLIERENRQRYVSEDLLGCRTYYQTPVWTTLVRKDGKWAFEPAQDQTDYHGGPKGLDPIVVERWAKYERLIERRYQRLENQWRAQNGLDPIVSERTPTLRADGKSLSTDESVSRLLALLEADAPAKTTRLTRPKEATHGTDNLAPAHHL